MQIRDTEFRSASQYAAILSKNHGIIRGFEFVFAEKMKTIYIYCYYERRTKKKSRLNDNWKLEYLLLRYVTSLWWCNLKTVE